MKSIFRYAEHRSHAQFVIKYKAVSDSAVQIAILRLKQMPPCKIVNSNNFINVSIYSILINFSVGNVVPQIITYGIRFD